MSTSVLVDACHYILVVVGTDCLLDTFWYCIVQNEIFYAFNFVEAFAPWFL